MEKKDLSNRVALIDEARGLAILLMVVYHTFYDLVVLFGLDIPAFYSGVVEILVALFGGLFIFISGTASHYSRNNLKRGAVCFALGMGLTAVTALFLPAETIRFGILHFLGIAMMLFPLLEPVVKKIPPVVGMISCLLLAIVLYHLPNGYIGFDGFLRIDLPRGPYLAEWLFWLGFPADSFVSSDYFPLLPWIFVFFSGAFFGVLVKGGRLPAWFYTPPERRLRVLRPLAFIGRHTLIIYLLHQPVVYGVLNLLAWAAGR